MTNSADAAEPENLKDVQQNGNLIAYIKNPSEAVQLAAVQKHGEAIHHIKNPSEAVQLAAVRQKWWAIRFIKNPTETALLAAVRQNGDAIQYIENPSEEVQLAAVTRNWFALKLIKNPSEAIQLAAFSNGGGIQAVCFWDKTFRPSAITIKNAIQESCVTFKTNQKPFKKDIKIILSCLKKQPAADILDLAAVAPELFGPPELREILRAALLQQATPTKGTPATRSM